MAGPRLAGRDLTVRRGVKRVHNRDATSPGRKTRLWIGELKTKRSRRTLYLTPPLIKLLHLHQVRQKAGRNALGEAWQDHGLIFCSRIGTPLDPDNVSQVFSRLCVQAGLGHRHPHELRHSGA